VARARTRFPAIREHVLLPRADRIEAVDFPLRARLGEAVFAEVLQDVPDAWLLPEPGAATPAAKRAVYIDYLVERLSAAPLFVEEAVRARNALV
jgi:hypothetical protein